MATKSEKSEVTEEQQIEANGEDDTSIRSFNEENDTFIRTSSNEENDTSTVLNTAAPLQLLYNSSSYCQMQCETTTIEYTWRIDRCPIFLKVMKNFMSSSFPETAKYKIKAEISSEPKWLESEVKFYLVTETPFNGICTVYMIKIDNEKYNKITSSSTWGVMSNMTLLCNTKMRNLYNYMSRDMITLNFTFEIFHRNLIDVSHAQSILLTKICPTNLNSNIFIINSKHLTHSPFNDIIIFLINGERYKISRNLIRNTRLVEYFCTTYKGYMENNFITIRVNTYMSQVFKILFSYIKTFCLILEELDISKAQTLLEIATRCDLNKLKVICEIYLIRTISFSSALKLLQCAISCNAQHLEKHVASFIKFHTDDIICTEEFKSLSQEQLDDIIKSIEKIKIIRESGIFELFSSNCLQ